MYIIRALDCTVGSFIHLWDEDTDRRELYGDWGAFRPKPYGVEWRVPSNKWLSCPDLWEWLFESVVYVVKQAHEGKIRYLPGFQPCTGDATTALLQARSLAGDGFPAFPIKKKTNKKILRGVRVASSASNAPYDLDLNFPRGGREYTNPGDLSSPLITEV
jgi:hypothetical protein